MQDWTRGQIVIAVGALVNSALYLSFVAVLGFLYANPVAALMSVAAMGVAFLGYSHRLCSANATVTNALTALSWILGVAAGLWLLWRAFA